MTFPVSFHLLTFGEDAEYNKSTNQYILARLGLLFLMSISLILSLFVTMFTQRRQLGYSSH